MKYTYEEIETNFGGIVIRRTDENGLLAWIPTDLGNSDYQAYLAAQSTPSL